MTTLLEPLSPAIEARRLAVGDGFEAIGLRAPAQRLDPFLMVDHYRMSQPTFGPHPHAGLSAISYVFEDSATGLVNRDSTGVVNTIAPGDLHWATAGRGMLHEEVPQVPGQVVHGLQIFVNLPAAAKQSPPRALHVRMQAMPAFVQAGGAVVRLLVGRHAEDDRVASVGGELPNEVTILDVDIPPGAAFDDAGVAWRNGFAYVVRGRVERAGRGFAGGEALWLLPRGAETRLRAPEGARLVVFAGAPLAEPIVWRGPFCANSEPGFASTLEAFASGAMGCLAPR